MNLNEEEIIFDGEIPIIFDDFGAGVPFQEVSAAVAIQTTNNDHQSTTNVTRSNITDDKRITRKRLCNPDNWKRNLRQNPSNI